MTKSKSKSKLTLQSLLNKCNENISMSKEDKEWDEMRPVGREYGSEEKGITKSIKTEEDDK